jgi:hypothetical protein
MRVAARLNCGLYFFALSLPASDAKRVESSRFASEKLAQKSIVSHLNAPLALFAMLSPQ